jgi:hypothetical protein
MRCASLAGTSPRNTRPSVPRLTPVCRVRTRTSPSPNGDRVSPRSSAWPGETTQQACAATGDEGSGTAGMNEKMNVVSEGGSVP